MIKKYGLKTFSQVRRKVRGQILDVRLCGSGKNAKYHVVYKESGSAGNKKRTAIISAR